MKEHTDVSQDPYGDGITNPIRDTPLDIGTSPPFPPNQDVEASTIGSAEPTVADAGPAGSAHTTYDNLTDC